MLQTLVQKGWMIGQCHHKCKKINFYPPSLQQRLGTEENIQDKNIQDKNIQDSLSSGTLYHLDKNYNNSLGL